MIKTYFKLKQSLFTAVNKWSNYRIKFKIERKGKIGWFAKNLIRGYPSLKKGEVLLFGRKFRFDDSLGFLHSYYDIFIDDSYKFNTNQSTIAIIDCGASFGLSIVYFKENFPDAKIIAFEADQNIFESLSANIAAFNYKDVQLVNKAVWISEDETLTFANEGSLSGHLVSGPHEESGFQSVKTTRLKKYLQTKIDFLKVDIEGAENTVIYDIAEDLHNVETLFIEYHSSLDEKQCLGDILSIVSKAGFRYYIKHANDYKKEPFVEKGTSPFDLQLNIFCTK